MGAEVNWGMLGTVFTGLAVVAAVIAIVFYRRQALAAEGDIAPTFDMKGQRTTSGEMGRRLEIDATNHNRSTVHVQAFWFRAPRGVDIFFKPGAADFYKEARRWTKLKFEMPVTPGKTTRFQFTFRRNRKRQPAPFFRIRCTVIYRVEGKTLPRCRNCSLQVQR